MLVVGVVALIVTCVSATSSLDGVTYGGELKIQEDVEDVIVSNVSFSDVVPSSWDWRKLGLMTTDLNQHIPTYW